MKLRLTMAGIAAVSIASLALAQDAADIERGKQAYYDYACYACHGFQGIGRRNLANRASGVLISEEVFLIYLRARGDHNPAISEQTMPHYPASSLPDEVARDIYAYILTFEDAPPPVEEIPALKDIVDAAEARQ